MGWYIAGGIIVVLIIALVVMYNNFVKLKNVVEEAFSTMDVYMKKRYDLIPNVVATVKGYATHERETLESVMNARSQALASSSVEGQAKAEGDLNQALGRLMMLTENYPDLKANTEFDRLQTQLATMETEIAQSRKYYNAVVRQYNTKCETFPSAIIANIFNFTKKPFFEVSNEAERENVKVEF